MVRVALMAVKIRKAMYAGSFYPEEKGALFGMVDSLLAKASAKKLPARLRALVVPHAGYVYSGPVAAFAYRALALAGPKRVVLLGPSHQAYFEGVYGFGGEWESPLGKIAVQNFGFPVMDDDAEHSLEVQLPFLQVALKKFEFVPVIYGVTAPDALAKISQDALGADGVIIASSDLSHYFPYEKAKHADKQTIDAALALDLDKFMEIGDACGKTGIAALIILAKKHKWRTVLLDYRNSGDTAGDKGSVVGYAAIAFYG